MRIGFDVSPITALRTGVGNYCYFLLKHLLENARGEDLIAFSSGRSRPDIDEFTKLAGRRHVPVPTRALYAAWEMLSWPRVDRLCGGLDVYHATNYVVPPVERARRVVTVHDLAFLTVPQYCSPKIVGPFARQIGKFCVEADAILAYSESTKRDIVDHLQIDAEKITVAPMAVDDDFAPVNRETATELVYEKYGIKTPYFLFVSTLEPRKNIVGLLRAFALLARDYPHKLVLVGGMGWLMEEEFRATIAELGIADRIVRPGFIPHHELPALYCAADAFLFPSHYEGFGLPLLEALHCGCPVVTSDNSSIPEVTGDAALRCSSTDIEGFAENVRRVLNDEALRDELIRKGRAHAARYSWRKCAEATLDVYKRVVA